jgi:hypothetical protein
MKGGTVGPTDSIEKLLQELENAAGAARTAWGFRDARDAGRNMRIALSAASRLLQRFDIIAELEGELGK